MLSVAILVKVVKTNLEFGIKLINPIPNCFKGDSRLSPYFTPDFCVKMRYKYLKHVRLPYSDGVHSWSVCPLTGSLLKGDAETMDTNIVIPIKVSDALRYCDQPYLCKTNKKIKINDGNLKLKDSLNKMHQRIITIGNKRFYLIRLYSFFKNILFTNTCEAIAGINNLPSHIVQKHQLCLPRAFLAAKISKSFYDHGVIFIGAFLPTGDMHAWIIENGKQPDIDDVGWINYRPLLAFYY